MDKKKFIYQLIFLIFISSFIFSLNNTIFVSGNSNIDYVFENNVFTELNNPSFLKGYNTKNPTFISDIYESTYSFTTDIIGNVPTDWTDGSGSDTSALIIKTINGHQNILELNDTSSSNRASILQTFTDGVQASGSVEWFWSMDDVTQACIFNFVNDAAGNGIILRIVGDDLEYRDSGGTYQTIIGLNDDTWYHIRVDFECGSGSYLGLNADRFFISINGIRYGEYTFRTASNNIELIQTYTDNTDINYKVFYDAFGFSWDSDYTLNSNSIPLTYLNSTLVEKDKWNFDYQTEGNLYSADASSITGWDNVGAQSSTNIKICNIYGKTERVLELAVGSIAPSEQGRKENDFTSNSLKLNFTLEFYFHSIDDTDHAFIFSVRSNDNTKVLEIESRVVVSGTSLDLYYITNSGKNKFANNIIKNDMNYLSVYLDYHSNTFTINYIKNGTHINSTIGQCLTTGKEGLKEIRVANKYYDTVISSTHKTRVLSVGVYDLENGSLTKDFGFLPIDLECTSDFIPYHHNLVSLEMTGVFDTLIQVENMNGTDDFKVRDRETLNGSTIFKNLYAISTSARVYTPFLCFYFYDSFENNSFSIDYIYIRGNTVIENDNLYWLSYVWKTNRISIQNSYFWVDSNNKLQFNITTDDDGLEYIQAILDLDSQSTSNYLLGFRCGIFGMCIGSLSIQYTSVSDVFLLEQLDKYYYESISQEKLINKIIFQITDNDLLNINYTTGYLSKLSLCYSTNIEVSLITLKLFNFLIPLIIIIAPSISIAESTKRKNLFIPIFFIISLSLTVSLIIPYWILFIISLAFFIFILSENKYFENKEE